MRSRVDQDWHLAANAILVGLQHSERQSRRSGSVGGIAPLLEDV